jgi:hypothetical protein
MIDGIVALSASQLSPHAAPPLKGGMASSAVVTFENHCPASPPSSAVAAAYDSTRRRCRSMWSMPRVWRHSCHAASRSSTVCEGRGCARRVWWGSSDHRATGLLLSLL